MCRKALFSAVLLVLSPISLAAADFTGVMALDAKGAAWEIRSSDPWHKGNTCSGLGFVVAIDDWPQLTQQCCLDRLQGNIGTREIQSIMRWHDLGKIRISGSAGGGKLVKSTWCNREYTFGPEDQALSIHVSRLTPALLLKTQATVIELFAGEKYVGERWPKDAQQKRTQAHIGSGGRTQVRTKDVPQYVAYVTAGKVVTASTENEIDLAAMTEPWLLFWYADKSQFLRTAAPNLLWRTEPLSNAMQDGSYFVSVDIPILVVLQHKPKLLTKTADALRLDFAEARTGSITVTPITGYHHLKVEETKKWVQALPADVIAKCRTWAKRSAFYPLTCSQTYNVTQDGSDVKINAAFTYEAIKGDWDFEAEKISPVPPAVALAHRYGYTVSLSGSLAPEAIMTHSGPYSGIVDQDAAEFSIKGLNKYVTESLKPAEAKANGARILADELRKEISKMVEAGHLAPAWLVGRKHTFRCETFFANAAYLMQVTADSLPYLGDGEKQPALNYLAGEIKLADPLTVSTVPIWEGIRREYYDIVSPEFYRKVTGEDIRTQDQIGEDKRLDNIYPLLSLAQASGSWDYLKSMWENFTKKVHDADTGTDWATCGYFKTSDAAAGGVPSTNAQFSRYIAMARVADRLGDSDAKDKAYYMLAKAAVRRFCQGKMMDYVYDEKFQELEFGADWMVKLSTSGGETGTAHLWFDDWRGAKEDVRVPVSWDEYGPVLDYMDDDWSPVLVWFQNITPELGRFLKDNLKAECDRQIAAVERNAPAWYVTDSESYLGKETSVDNPENASSIFLAKCYIQGNDGPTMLKYQDVPLWKVGDLLHMSKLIANLHAFGGIEFEPLKGGAQ